MLQIIACQRCLAPGELRSSTLRGTVETMIRSSLGEHRQQHITESIGT
jgi:hypothetical protein